MFSLHAFQQLRIDVLLAYLETLNVQWFLREFLHLIKQKFQCLERIHAQLGVKAVFALGSIRHLLQCLLKWRYGIEHLNRRVHVALVHSLVGQRTVTRNLRSGLANSALNDGACLGNRRRRSRFIKCFHLGLNRIQHLFDLGFVCSTRLEKKKSILRSIERCLFCGLLCLFLCLVGLQHLLRNLELFFGFLCFLDLFVGSLEFQFCQFVFGKRIHKLVLKCPECSNPIGCLGWFDLRFLDLRWFCLRFLDLWWFNLWWFGFLLRFRSR